MTIRQSSPSVPSAIGRALGPVLLLLGLGLGLVAAEPCFPGAVGYGAATRGGLDGRVIQVTTLASAGPGSLRAALAAEGPRVVVFAVGGVIDLEGEDLAVEHPRLTLAGHTAPAPGITIVRGGLKIRTHDVVVRHLTVRPGDAGREKGSGWEPDAVTVGDWNGRPVHDVVVDHCTFTWAVDENASVSGKEPYAHDVTFSNCIIAHGLSHATHKKGEHSKGTLIHDHMRRVALIGNCYAHNFRRSPYIKRGCEVYVANNLIYNPGQLGCHISNFKNDPPVVSLVGNVFRAGPDTPEGLSLIATLGGGIRIHRVDNLAFDRTGEAQAVDTKGGTHPEVKKWRARYQRVDEGVEAPAGIEPLPADQVAESVVTHAGARPWDRDPIDQTLIAEIVAGEGAIIDSQDEVGGYPEREATSHELDPPEGAEALRAWLAGFIQQP